MSKKYDQFTSLCVNAYLGQGPKYTVITLGTLFLTMSCIYWSKCFCLFVFLVHYFSFILYQISKESKAWSLKSLWYIVMSLQILGWCLGLLTPCQVLFHCRKPVFTRNTCEFWHWPFCKSAAEIRNCRPHSSIIRVIFGGIGTTLLSFL